MSKQTFSIGYYRAVFEDEKREGSRVHNVLTQLNKLTQQKRVRPIGNDHFRLHEYRKLTDLPYSHEVWFGQIIRHRSDTGLQSDFEGNIDDLDIPEDQYLSECGHFLVLPAYKTIVYAGNPQKVGWTQFRKYVNTVESSQPLHMLPVPDSDKLNTYQRINRPKKVVLQIANPEKWDLGGNQSTARSIRQAKQYGADHVKIEFRSDRPWSHYLSDGVKTFIDWGRSNEPEDGLLEKAYIDGYHSYENEDGQAKESVEFVRDRLTDSYRIDTSEIRTYSDYRANAQTLLIKSLDQNKHHIYRSFNEK